MFRRAVFIELIYLVKLFWSTIIHPVVCAAEAAVHKFILFKLSIAETCLRDGAFIHLYYGVIARAKEYGCRNNALRDKGGVMKKQLSILGFVALIASSFTASFQAQAGDEFDTIHQRFDHAGRLEAATLFSGIRQGTCVDMRERGEAPHSAFLVTVPHSGERYPLAAMLDSAEQVPSPLVVHPLTAQGWQKQLKDSIKTTDYYRDGRGGLAFETAAAPRFDLRVSRTEFRLEADGGVVVKVSCPTDGGEICWYYDRVVRRHAGFRYCQFPARSFVGITTDVAPEIVVPSIGHQKSTGLAHPL